MPPHSKSRDRLKKFLRAILSRALYNLAVFEPEPLQQVQRTWARVGRRTLSYFAGCDYFRLASHPRIAAALLTGLKRYGLNVAASRLTTGNHRLYGQLENRLAQFFHVETALLASSGYLTNLVVAQALARHFSHALIDRAAHPSLQDAARSLDCPVVQFQHRDPADLAACLRRCGPQSRVIVLTDGMFARDGSVAPLRQYLEGLPQDATVLLDDAHGAGVLGACGRGTPEHEGARDKRIIQTITLSKAFGVYGGAILGTSKLRRQCVTGSHLFAGSTPLPLPLVYAALEAVRILGSDKRIRHRLKENASYVRGALRAAGLDVPETPGPIFALYPRTAKAVAKLKQELLAQGIFPPFIRYPGGPASGYFRFVISSEHSKEQLDRLIKALTM
ncbi:MAG TPA: pyridoxal phosphate-dependent aminotransferase family protein [Verrucomicrobiae bacterium]|nr:pyridoxal phosphate-dependent aminotransferase family protein [Verrucomicrobiae bacterium]